LKPKAFFSVILLLGSLTMNATNACPDYTGTYRGPDNLVGVKLVQTGCTEIVISPEDPAVAQQMALLLDGREHPLPSNPDFTLYASGWDTKYKFGIEIELGNERTPSNSWVGFAHYSLWMFDSGPVMWLQSGHWRFNHRVSHGKHRLVKVF
jgi:hypothetical protein